VNINSGTWTNSDNLTIGNAGTGSLSIDGAGIVSNESGYIGRSGGGNGTVSISGGTWTNSSNLTIGNSGTGSLTISGTGNVTSSNGMVGQYASSNGTVNVIGGTWTNSGNLTIGSIGTGSLTINGTGTVIVGATLSRGANGAINLESGGTLQIGTGSTTGTLATNLTNNGTVIFNRANDSTLSSNISGTGALTKNGSGNLTLSGANTYTGTTTINAGSIVLGANQTLGGIAGAGNIQLSNYTLTTSAAANLTFSGSINGSGGLTKEGSGMLTLTGANTYNGTTVINAGTIQIGSGGATGSLSASSTIINNGTLVFNRSNTVTQGTDFADGISGTGNVVQSGSGLLILSGNNTYTGTTTLTSGTLQVGTDGNLGGGNYSENISNNGTMILGSNSNQTLSGVISGSGAITKNGTGTLTLTGSNNFSGNTTINTGTVVIGNANAAGTGRIIQTNGSSLLKIDTTGMITNAISVYNVVASQSATLSGEITVNNAVWDVNTGTTLTISGDIDGSGGVTKNGNGTLVLSGNNTYTAATVVNAGTLEAASANALGSNNTVQVNGGTLLVVTDGALEDKNITLSTSSVGLRFSNTYNGTIGNLTLSANSTLDLGGGSVIARFASIALGGHTLRIYNWTGEAYLWGTNRDNTDQVYIMAPVTPDDLEKISFYSGAVGSDSFMGTGFELGFSSGFENQIIPVPEPETWATGLLLVLGGAVWLWKKRRNITTEFTEEG
jgi:autotransporter-associated beta strand protein/T5SS/PEP-CTERM-associated repeat protein